MATTFSSLPVLDLSLLSSPSATATDLQDLSKQLYDVFATTGFAYFVGCPLSFSHDDVFSLTRDFFSLSDGEKMALSKRSFVPTNPNTYRGYFPPQPGQSDNLKEGFEIGSPHTRRPHQRRYSEKVQLSESNVWPSEELFRSGRSRLEKLHEELQTLGANLLSLCAVGLGQSPDLFSAYLVDSLSTLRLLHYPPQSEEKCTGESKLCCTPHTDSGILTLLHQDPTGGLEVQNANGEWISAPYIPSSIVCNIGDLLASVSGGRFVATMHRVRASPKTNGDEDGFGRFSVPFFFEPGEDCVVSNIDGGNGIVYGEHVRRKMGTWVEFQDPPERAMGNDTTPSIVVEA